MKMFKPDPKVRFKLKKDECSADCTELHRVLMARCVALGLGLYGCKIAVDQIAVKCATDPLYIPPGCEKDDDETSSCGLNKYQYAG